MSDKKILGIDISSWQTNIDWKKIKSEGVEFAIIRAGYGSNESQIDRNFKTHIENALAAGVNVGIYWFGYAYTVDTAKKEADVCHNIIKSYKNKITLPVFYDWEYDSARYAKNNGVTPTKKLVTDMTIAFMDRMKEHGYKTGYYTNLDYMKNMYEYDRVKNYDLWMAYYSDEKASYNCSLQQYTSTGRLNGYNGNLDLNWMYKNYDETVKESSKKSEETKKSTNAQTSTQTKTYTVKSGDTLSSIAAKYGTTYQLIAKHNGISDPNVIYVGQKIRIPTTSNEKVETKPTKQTTTKTYTVKSGDTLSSIAAKYGTTYQELAKDNGISDPNVIYVGQKIKIP